MQDFNHNAKNSTFLKDKKDDGRQFYQFAQSFPEEDNTKPLEVHRIGLELAQKLFSDLELMVATHYNTKHPYNHIVMNSVSNRLFS